ncbi:MAG: hypothetical protein Q4F41_18975 [Eubacteriales bacterium]|nr:hypothetical protein [Eubacteriales bacterium]
MIFTGERAERPETVSLTEEFFGGEECAIEVKVKMIYGNDVWKEPENGAEKDIISQYIAFTKVYNEQFKLYKRSRKTITETIRICKDRNVLKEYLQSREKEVVGIMMTLFDEERIVEIYAENKAREAAEKAAKEATEKATKETSKKVAERMLKEGKFSIEEIATYFTELSMEEIQELKDHLTQTV